MKEKTEKYPYKWLLQAAGLSRGVIYQWEKMRVLPRPKSNFREYADYELFGISFLCILSKAGILDYSFGERAFAQAVSFYNAPSEQNRYFNLQADRPFGVDLWIDLLSAKNDFENALKFYKKGN